MSAVPFCPKCGKPMQYREGGVSSKTGRPYKPFWTCQDRNCGGTLNVKDAPAPVAPPQAAPVQAAVQESRELPIRVQAAMAALEAAAVRHSGMTATFDGHALLCEASYFYHAFLKPAMFGDVPEPEEVAKPGETPVPF